MKQTKLPTFGDSVVVGERGKKKNAEPAGEVRHGHHYCLNNGTSRAHYYLGGTLCVWPCAEDYTGIDSSIIYKHVANVNLPEPQSSHL